MILTFTASNLTATQLDILNSVAALTDLHTRDAVQPEAIWAVLQHIKSGMPDFLDSASGANVFGPCGWADIASHMLHISRIIEKGIDERHLQPKLDQGPSVRYTQLADGYWAVFCGSEMLCKCVDEQTARDKLEKALEIRH